MSIGYLQLLSSTNFVNFLAVNPKTQKWLVLAVDDLEFGEEILKNGKRPHWAAHLCHQAIEKLLKAIVQERKNEPPTPTHNFKILCKEANIQLSEEKMQWLMGLAPHYIGTRYPEDIFKLQKKYSQDFCENLFKETKEFFEWLKNNYLK